MINEFFLTCDIACKLDTPDHLFSMRETELGIRDAELRRPTPLIDSGCHVPDGIPIRVSSGVVIAVCILFDPSRIDTELESGALVVV